MPTEKIIEMLVPPALMFAASYGGIRTALAQLIKRVETVEGKVDVVVLKVAKLEGALGVD